MSIVLLFYAFYFGGNRMITDCPSPDGSGILFKFGRSAGEFKKIERTAGTSSWKSTFFFVLSWHTRQN